MPQQTEHQKGDVKKNEIDILELKITKLKGGKITGDIGHQQFQRAGESISKF